MRKISNRVERGILWGLFLGSLLVLLVMSPSYVYGDELVHTFKNPSFSGVNQSSHYLTIENQEKSRKDAIQDDIEAALLAAKRAEDNTTLAKFIRNLESRIFAQLSKQLVEQLFSGTGATFGSFVLEGNTITYQKTTCDPSQWACTEGDEVIVMIIVGEDGTETTIVIPIGVGTFEGNGDG
jgi:hypothetical protein